MLRSNRNGRPRPERARDWSPGALRQRVERLQRMILEQAGTAAGSADAAVVDGIVTLGAQPENLKALRQRRNPMVAVRDLAIRYAFNALMNEGRAIYELDTMSQTLIQQTLELINRRAEQVARCKGEHPLDEDPGLLLSLCRSFATWRPERPLGWKISAKLGRFESDVSRAMRQIENLVKRPEVAEAFVAHVLEMELPPAFQTRVRELHASDTRRAVTLADPIATFKAGLLQMARGGGREGVNFPATIRFFALPETVAFVKQFAGTIQTARTLYAEEEYEDIPWRGKRRLPRDRRQGYMEVALASVARRQDRSLDTLAESDEDGEPGLHELVPGEADLRGREVVQAEGIKEWITRHALAEQPEDTLWQVCGLLYVDRVAEQEILAHGLATEESLGQARKQMAALVDDPEVQQAWWAAKLA